MPFKGGFSFPGSLDLGNREIAWNREVAQISEGKAAEED